MVYEYETDRESTEAAADKMQLPGNTQHSIPFAARSTGGGWEINLTEKNIAFIHVYDPGWGYTTFEFLTLPLTIIPVVNLIVLFIDRGITMSQLRKNRELVLAKNVNEIFSEETINFCVPNDSFKVIRIGRKSASFQTDTLHLEFKLMKKLKKEDCLNLETFVKSFKDVQFYRE